MQREKKGDKVVALLIPNMEKPDDCRVCSFLRYEVDCGRSSCIVTCRILADNYNVLPFDGVPVWCPIKEIEKHGDLVDRSYLLSEYDRQHIGKPGGARKIMETAPTIIQGNK